MRSIGMFVAMALGLSATGEGTPPPNPQTLGPDVSPDARESANAAWRRWHAPANRAARLRVRARLQKEEAAHLPRIAASKARRARRCATRLENWQRQQAGYYAAA